MVELTVLSATPLTRNDKIFDAFLDVLLHMMSWQLFSNLLYIINSHISLYSLYYAKACNEFAGHISTSLHPGNTAPFTQVSQQWQTIGNPVFVLTSMIFEPQSS